jgi:hypothetical protein
VEVGERVAVRDIMGVLVALGVLVVVLETRAVRVPDAVLVDVMEAKAVRVPILVRVVVVDGALVRVIVDVLVAVRVESAVLEGSKGSPARVRSHGTSYSWICGPTEPRIHPPSPGENPARHARRSSSFILMRSRKPFLSAGHIYYKSSRIRCEGCRNAMAQFARSVKSKAQRNRIQKKT